LYQTEAGIDVVRAVHLDMTGRSIPKDPPVTRRRFIVEHLDSAVYLTDQPSRTPSVADHPYAPSSCGSHGIIPPAVVMGYPLALDGPEQTFAPPPTTCRDVSICE
jgi:hypothetical protein